MTKIHKVLYIIIGIGLISSLSLLSMLPTSTTARLGHSIQYVKNTGVSVVTISEAFIREETISLEDPYTMLILGRTGGDHAAPNLTDTIVVVHLIPGSPPTPLLLSLPRDLIVPIDEDGTVAKINSLYQRFEGGSSGRNAIRTAVSDITNLPIDTTVIVDLAAFTSVIDAVGGINIYVRDNLIDTKFPTKLRGITTVSFEEGWRWMDGETATAYVRTRATPRGDFDRITRQQDVLRTLHQKVIGLHPLWDLPTLLSIWHTLGAHIESDLGVADIKTLVNVARDVSIDDVKHVFIDPSRTDLVSVHPIMLGNIPAYAIAPQEGIGQYEAIQEYIQSLIE